MSDVEGTRDEYGNKLQGLSVNPSNGSYLAKSKSALLTRQEEQGEVMRIKKSHRTYKSS